MKKSNVSMLRKIIIVLAVSCVAMIGATPLFADIFGYQTPGSSDDWSMWAQIGGSVFTIPEDGTATQMSAYIGSYSDNLKIKTAIYKHSDSTLVAESLEENINATGTHIWQDFTISASLTADTEYVLVLMSDGNIPLTYNGGDTDQGHKQGRSYSDGFPGTASFNHNNNKYSIYCTYTPGGGGVPEVPAGAMPFMGALCGFVYVTIRGSRRK